MKNSAKLVNSAMKYDMYPFRILANKYDLDSKIDTVVISGMGGKTIVDIIQRGKDKLNNIKKIILSPNNDYYLVRKKVTSLGYKIYKEEVVFDKNKFYPAMVFIPGKTNYKDKELFYGVNLVENNDLYNYYKYLYNSYDYKIKKLPFKYILKKIDLLLKKSKLKRKINKISMSL